MSFVCFIRPAGENDLNGLKELLRLNGQKPTIVIDDRSLYYLAALTGNTMEDETGGLIGLIGAEISGDAALIRSTAVLPAYRTKGIAKKLVSALLPGLKDKGIQQLYLFSRDTGAFWENFGFTRCGVEEVAERLPDVPQVMGYVRDNSIWSDVAWRRRLI